MSFRSIVRDVKDGVGSLSRRSFDVGLSGLHSRGKSQGSINDLNDNPVLILVQNSRWANLPPELLFDVIKRLEESESTWPARKNVVACAAVCRSWRSMCKEIVGTPESCGKLTFPVSLKQPGPHDVAIQCFIKRDEANLTYHLFLRLSPAALLVENGKFMLSAKRTRRTTFTGYLISMDAENISRSTNTYIGKLRSNFLGTKFIIYDTQPPHSAPNIPPPGRSKRFDTKKVSPKVICDSYDIAHISYACNGRRCKMHCVMHSIPASALEPGGSVPGQPEFLLPPRSLEDSFRSMSFSRSLDHSNEFSSSRFSDIMGAATATDVPDSEKSKMPLVLKTKSLSGLLNYKGRVVTTSVKSFQLVVSSSQPPARLDKVILQFRKVGKDVFTMDYQYPLSAFQAFAICLSSFGTKLGCE